MSLLICKGAILEHLFVCSALATIRRLQTVGNRRTSGIRYAYAYGIRPSRLHERLLSVTPVMGF